jgi:hypothetical protein
MVELQSWTTGVVATPRKITLLEQRRAAEAWRRILEKRLSVIFKNSAGQKLPGQVVRVESDNTATPSMSTVGSAPKRKVIVYGIRNHATLPNTDIKENYVFVYDGDQYRCIDIIITLGEIQTIWEAYG